MRVVAAAALVCLLAGCGSSASSPTPTSGPASVGATAGASASPAAIWLPPWAGPDTPAAVVARSGLPFCGVEQGPGPALTINREIRGCFLGGYQDGTGAEFASIQSTMEGDPIATIWRTIPSGGVELLIDSTQDKFGSGTWMRMTCRQLVADQGEVFTVDGCDEGVAIQ